MFFSEIIGQQEIKSRLIKSVGEERISHAQLFAGTEGVGKLALALAYAQYISCRNRTGSDSCGVCPSCHKYQKLEHPDLHFVFPVYSVGKIKKPTSDDFIKQWREFVLANPYFTLNQWLSYIDVENAQGMIYEAESASIIRKLNMKSFEAEFKVMIIWLPERMNISCANKLLKMIEEPPSKTLFLLITENEENIITTIRSRAQLVKIPRIDPASMRDTLKKHESMDEGVIEGIVHLANGDFIKALEYINPDDEKKYYFKKFQELMRFAYKPETLELIKWADELSRIGREKQKEFLNFALRLAREYFILNLNKENLIYLNKEEKEWGQKFAPFLNERNISQITAEYELAYKHISMNGNPRIIFLDIALRMAKLIKR
ncbi:DNA polymerase III delta prime subunit [hydrothermal vent metagenome]|uniref:DNA polymerase III delta prime subunit n=1 Tax=hydrothermal vent metagenome TaxID=652676 RepID=A0A3B0U5V6_9ZZZZ